MAKNSATDYTLTYSNILLSFKKIIINDMKYTFINIWIYICLFPYCKIIYVRFLVYRSTFLQF
jgi:hypothetical protein